MLVPVSSARVCYVHSINAGLVDVSMCCLSVMLVLSVFVTNKHIYDFLSVNDCELRSFSHRFRNI